MFTPRYKLHVRVRGEWRDVVDFPLPGWRAAQSEIDPFAFARKINNETTIRATSSPFSLFHARCLVFYPPPPPFFFTTNKVELLLELRARRTDKFRLIPSKTTF